MQPKNLLFLFSVLSVLSAYFIIRNFLNFYAGREFVMQFEKRQLKPSSVSGFSSSVSQSVAQSQLLQSVVCVYCSKLFTQLKVS